MDLSTKITRTNIVAGGFNPITPEVKDWYDVTIRSSSATVNVATSSSEAANGNGISVPMDGQLTMVIGPGTQLFAGGATGEVLTIALTPRAEGLRYLAMLERQGQLIERLLGRIEQLVARSTPRKRSD